MTFEEIISNVEINTEKKAFMVALDGQNFENAKPLAETVKLVNVIEEEDINTVKLEIRRGTRKQTILTDKEKDYFSGLIGKMVYVSGLKTGSRRTEKWFLMACYDVTDREEGISKCDLISEEEKRVFQNSVEKFRPEIQKDLANNKIQLHIAGVKEEENKEKQTTFYNEVEELNAKYQTLKPVISPEFRTAYEHNQYSLQRNASKSEKLNCIKIMQEILDIDWLNNYEYKDIDTDEVEMFLKGTHIGHCKQIDMIITELKASNISKKPPKTINLIGRSGVGCNSFAENLAKALGKTYSIIDLAGVNVKDADSLIGSSRIYENAHVGLLFEKIKEAGPFGIIILKHIDQYDTDVLRVLNPLIQKGIYQDNFTEIDIDLSNMLVVATSNSVKDLPISLRSHMNEIYFPNLSEKEIITIINKIIIPKYCEEFNLEFHHEVPEEVCRTLIYKLANMDMHKLDAVIRSIVVKTVSKKEREFSDYTSKGINELDFEQEDYEKIRNEYVTEITAVEHKFFTCYDEYPECIQKKMLELLNELHFSTDETKKIYARDAMHYLANVFNNKITPFEINSIVKELEHTHYLQGDVASKIERAILSKTLEKEEGKMIVLGLKGPAGTGKTSTAKSVAKALGRESIKVNVGGSSGSLLIKGLNPAIPNAAPGMIMKELAKSGCGSYSSVIILDELDKASNEFYNALYEFLDPNEEFYYDEYLELKIPKNKFVVILTFNEIQNIPLPIRDRMQIIEYENYSLKDKKNIINNYVRKRISEKYDVTLKINEDALEQYINFYDIVPGVRDAERDFENVLMYIVSNNHGVLNREMTISKKDIMAVLDEMRSVGLANIPQLSKEKCGVAQALAVAGDIGLCFAIETIINPYQKKDIVITGLPEGSCLESVSLACSLASLYLKQELPKLHLHMTDAVRKDGPSAGVTIYMSIMSCLLKKPLPNCAFTGSIDLFSNIGIVGGVFEKLIAAERCHIDKVYIPAENYKLLLEKKQMDRLNIQVIPVTSLAEVVKDVWELRLEA